MNNVTVLFPGGFKPITGAHMALAQRYAQNPSVNKVIMLIGPKEREGITRDTSIKMFNLLNRNNNIEIQSTDFNSPIMAAYEYLFSLPEDAQGQFALAASEKDEDYVRVKTFLPNVDKYKLTGDRKGRKIPAGIDAVELTVSADPLKYDDGNAISASAVRAALNADEYSKFKSSYPGYDESIIKNLWQMLGGAPTYGDVMGVKEWFLQEFENDANEIAEQMGVGYMTPKGAVAHQKKIKKLRKFLDKKNDRGFTYDFDKYPKTVFGTKYLNEGGLAGHMSHPFDKNRSQSLTFADFKEMIQRGLQGRLDIESAVTEKTDGQNIFVTYKDGAVKFARNKTERVNPLSVEGLQAKFAGRGPISDAFGEAGNDLEAAFSKVGNGKLESIFQNGKVFANMEIIYPETKNVIAYEIAVLQFHNLVEYDENGNVVQTDMTGGAVIQRAIQDANAHMQKTFNLIPPQKIKVGRVENFQDYEDALFTELNQLRDKYQLQDTSYLSDYHKAWWKDVIKEKANEMNYDISDDLIEQLTNRWSFNDKSNSIVKIKKMIDNPEFLEWVSVFDKKDFKQYQKDNLQPFESIFLKLGAEIMKNASNFLAANPNKAVQSIRSEIAGIIRTLRSTNDIAKMDLLRKQLERIKRLGGFEKIVPVEGIVFTYGGNTYKLTGAFAPINQILGTLKYSR
jgi:hypothetical protein